jgi:hypothetical protein
MAADETDARRMQARIRRLPTFTSVEVTGLASLQRFIELIEHLSQQTRERGDKRVLVDLLGVEGELKFTEHFQLGEEVARRMKHLERLASVVPREKATHTSEKVAVMQGFQLRVFTSVGEAIRWLEEASSYGEQECWLPS